VTGSDLDLYHGIIDDFLVYCQEQRAGFYGSVIDGFNALLKIERPENPVGGNYGPHEYSHRAKALLSTKRT
jgi:hypothetical protein